MKGLLLKDFYLIKKYCVTIVLCALVFIGLSLVAENNVFFSFYACLFGGMIPLTLLGYDERSKWEIYAGTLPYTKAMIVSVKYLIGLIAQLGILLVTGVTQALRMCTSGTFQLNTYMTMLSVLTVIAFFYSSVILLLSFRYGVEKGRFAYYVMIIPIAVANALVMNLIDIWALSSVLLNGIMILAAAALYAGSWYLSIVFYRRREIA